MASNIDSAFRGVYWLWTSSVISLFLLIGDRFEIAMIPATLFLAVLSNGIMRREKPLLNFGDPRNRFIWLAIVPFSFSIWLAYMIFSTPVIALVMLMVYLIVGFYAITLLPKMIEK